MAKCYNCGKNFDYDKYYGICPKCSAYNREKLPEEEHQELHEEYDQVKECNNLNGQEYHEMPDASPDHGYQSTSEQGSPGYQNTSEQGSHGYRSTSEQGSYGYVPLEDRPNSYGYVSLEKKTNTYYGQGPSGGGRPKSSGASIVVFILLILGIVATIATPIIYMMGKSVQLSMRVVKDVKESYGDWNGDNRAYLDDYEDEIVLPEMDQPRQSVEPVTAEVGSTCLFGNSQALAVTVTGQPYVKAVPGQVEGFPAGEKLIAIPVSYVDESDPSDSYCGLGTVYAGYGDQAFKTILNSYDVEAYALDLDISDVVDDYDVIGESGQGEFMVFVPEEITEISLYMESRDEDDNQMLGLYEVSLVIQAENGEAE